jgi:hypothetical protein
MKPIIKNRQQKWPILTEEDGKNAIKDIKFSKMWQSLEKAIMLDTLKKLEIETDQEKIWELEELLLTLS